MADYQKVVSFRRLSISGFVDFAVGRIDAHLQDADKHTAAVRDVIHRRLWQIGKMDTVGNSRTNGNSFHEG